MQYVVPGVHSHYALLVIYIRIYIQCIHTYSICAVCILEEAIYCMWIVIVRMTQPGQSPSSHMYQYSELLY